MTDDVDRRGDRADRGETDAPYTETGRDGPSAEIDATVETDVPVDFADLSLPQRAFVAAVQNPTRGVVIVGLLAFAFSFYVAFWLVFPRVAALASLFGAVVFGLIALGYFLSGRLSI